MNTSLFLYLQKHDNPRYLLKILLKKLVEFWIQCRHFVMCLENIADPFLQLFVYLGNKSKISLYLPNISKVPPCKENKNWNFEILLQGK